ncbi:MAG: L,D-transpeptidase [Verrucomicrobiota bacterium]
MQPFPRKIRVDVPAQRLQVLENDRIMAEFPVSTSARGLGSEPGSFKTPFGRFTVGAMIGDGAPLGAIFKSRVPTGELGPLESPGGEDDFVQTRILWLEGAEPHNANTRDRYIYIHGTNHEERIGEPCSHGCVRMRNADVAELFTLIEPGTEVFIG